MTVRTLSAADLPALMQLKEVAGWNQTAEDLSRLLRLDPSGCFGVSDDGRLVASATVITYGQELAWIGMVLTLPDYRGRGLARRLMEQAISYSGQRVMGLDASDMGKPLYASMGFYDLCPIERWHRDAAPLDFQVEPEPLRIDLALDRSAFGFDRSVLLEELRRGGGGASAGTGYGLDRPGSGGHYFGPCVTDAPEEFEVLLRSCVARHASGPVKIDIFPDNKRVVTIAALLGFRPVRRLTRMFIGPGRQPIPDERVRAIAGFELG